MRFEGRSGSTDRDVLKALISIGLDYSTEVPMASLRDLHLRSGRSVGAVRSSLVRLENKGIISKGSPGRSGKAPTYRLDMHALGVDATDPVDSVSHVRTAWFPEDHPLLCSRRGVGGRPAEVWCRLPRRPLKVFEASELLGYSQGVTRRALDKLVSFGLATVVKRPGKSSIYLCVDVSAGRMDDIAKSFGVFEDVDAKKAKVREERKKWEDGRSPGWRK
ncbi:hypothetical protein ACFYZX_03890 [Nocardiopsis dassonvillei]